MDDIKPRELQPMEANFTSCIGQIVRIEAFSEPITRRIEAVALVADGDMVALSVALGDAVADDKIVTTTIKAEQRSFKLRAEFNGMGEYHTMTWWNLAADVGATRIIHGIPPFANKAKQAAIKKAEAYRAALLPDNALPLKLNAFAVALLAPFTSQTETIRRPYLNGLFVTPNPAGGVDMVATDSCQMAIYHDAEGVASAPAIYRLTKKLVDACGAAGRIDKRYVILMNDRLAVVDASAQDGVERYIQAGNPIVCSADQYPKYEWLMRDVDKAIPGMHGVFQPQFMGRLAAAEKRLRLTSRLLVTANNFSRVCGMYHFMKDTGGGKNHGMAITRFTVDENFAVFSMPMHSNKEELFSPMPSGFFVPPKEDEPCTKN